MLVSCNIASGMQGRFRGVASILLWSSLLLTAGCKTSGDAAAAATQMSATAKSLSDYYTALGVILVDTGQIFALNKQLYSKPYTAENRQLLQNEEADLAKRAALAASFSTMASEFAKLTGSTAPADVSASAAKLQTECDTLASFKASAEEQNAMKTALQLLVTAIQEHKEREAAKAMDGFAKALSDFFTKEAPAWNSLEQVYAQLASTLAGDLVSHNAVDNSALLSVALTPFGLTPAVPSGDLNAKLTPLAMQQIATRKAALDSAYLSASDAMAKSLQEMSQRIHLVAVDQPMAFRTPPLTVATVEQWAAKVASF